MYGMCELHSEEVHDLYSSPNIVRVAKSSRTRWAGHVARMGEREKKRIQGFGGNPEINHLEGLGVDRTITIKCVFNKSTWMTWAGLI